MSRAESRSERSGIETVDVRGRLGENAPPEFPWLVEAARLYDGEGDEDLATSRGIIRLVEKIDTGTFIDIPWCGLFVGHCIATAFPEHPVRCTRIRARPWLRFGESVEPQLGAILVFWLRWPSSPFGHVGFYWGEDDDHYHVLGGNQRDRILLERFPKARLIGTRWPPGVAAPGIRRKVHPDHAEPFEHGDE